MVGRCRWLPKAKGHGRPTKKQPVPSFAPQSTWRANPGTSRSATVCPGGNSRASLETQVAPTFSSQKGTQLAFPRATTAAKRREFSELCVSFPGPKGGPRVPGDACVFRAAGLRFWLPLPQLWRWNPLQGFWSASKQGCSVRRRAVAGAEEVIGFFRTREGPQRLGAACRCGRQQSRRPKHLLEVE